MSVARSAVAALRAACLVSAVKGPRTMAVSSDGLTDSDCAGRSECASDLIAGTYLYSCLPRPSDAFDQHSSTSGRGSRVVVGRGSSLVGDGWI